MGYMIELKLESKYHHVCNYTKNNHENTKTVKCNIQGKVLMS